MIPKWRLANQRITGEVLEKIFFEYDPVISKEKDFREDEDREVKLQSMAVKKTRFAPNLNNQSFYIGIFISILIN